MPIDPGLLADTPADRDRLDAMRKAAGITVRFGSSRKGSLMDVKRWIVRQNQTLRMFRTEAAAEAYANKLAEGHI